MANKHRRRWSTSLVIRETQTKTRVKYHFTPTRAAVNKCCRGCGGKGTFTPCWWEHKMMQLLWGNILQVLKRRNRVTIEVKLLSCIRFFATPGTIAYQAPSMGFSRQEYWSGLFPSPGRRVTIGASNSTPRYASKRNENVMSTQKFRHKYSQQHLSSKK